MTPDELRSLAFDRSYAAHLAELAHTGDHAELQAEADELHAIADRIQALQEQPHTEDCATREAGTTEYPNCSCGRDARIRQAGGKARR